MTTTKEQLLTALTTGQSQVSSLLKSVAAVQDWQSSPIAWSFRFVAAHLTIMDEDCFLERITRIASGQNPQFDYCGHSDRNFNEFDLLDSLQSWRTNRQKIIAIVSALPQESLSLSGHHASLGTMTVLDTLQIIIDHDQQHLQDLKQNIAYYKQATLKNRCRLEIVELHQFFKEWLNGEIEPATENFVRVRRVIAEDFVIISPSGVLTERIPLLNGLQDSYNSRQKCKIWIEKFRLHQLKADMAVVTYEEWQSNPSGPTTSRLSTAIFQEQEGTPNGVVWLHVHETWLASQ